MQEKKKGDSDDGEAKSIEFHHVGSILAHGLCNAMHLTLYPVPASPHCALDGHSFIYKKKAKQPELLSPLHTT